MEQYRSPLIVYANFHSDMAVEVTAHDVLSRWAEQAPRKIWLMRPGDVLVTPVSLSTAFRGYAAELLRVPADSVTVVTVPPVRGVPMAEAVRRARLMDTLHSLTAERPGIQLLPVALDTSAVDFAARLGVPVAPYGPKGPKASALEAAYRLNTKNGFRAVAGELGIRLAPGEVCGGTNLSRTVRAMLARYERVAVKPDRSAGGYGLSFVSRTDPVPTPGERAGPWVVEQCLDAVRAVSVQMEAFPAGPRLLFSGEMRTTTGSFVGYVSPLEDRAGTFADELEHWGSALGRHLAAHGYVGPYGIDAVLASDGRLYATESNVRRTATITPWVMVDRLNRTGKLSDPAWLLGRGRSRAQHGFADAVGLLRAEELAWESSRGEGVVLYADAPADRRSWRYAVIGANRPRVTELEAALRNAMKLEVILG
ncbi:peptide ligase PGM1-related protein [Streptomyces sp.]|uniref:preATP grasp domain-containing protein n=1 Tax=Streptomyces sp. TaxID=1931 RepID=UPI002D76942C|nr:peptide ligase PGM1-related protein [Streptomyces sp.]HET6357407.1 peptide ligase PGM1-related protein [Streptomyces sp.]